MNWCFTSMCLDFAWNIGFFANIMALWLSLCNNGMLSPRPKSPTKWVSHIASLHAWIFSLFHVGPHKWIPCSTLLHLSITLLLSLFGPYIKNSNKLLHGIDFLIGWQSETSCFIPRNSRRRGIILQGLFVVKEGCWWSIECLLLSTFKESLL